MSDFACHGESTHRKGWHLIIPQASYHYLINGNAASLPLQKILHKDDFDKKALWKAVKQEYYQSMSNIST